jgi:AcrR family transcriptional regulator
MIGNESIYRVACRIFRERGYHATSMRTIASALGVRPATLYYYYPSKDDLLFSIMKTSIERLIVHVSSQLRRDAPAAEQLRCAMRAHIVAIAEHLDELTVFLHEFKSLPLDLRTVITEYRDRYERIFRDIVADGVKRGDFRPVDERLASKMILSACNWLYTWYHPDGSLSPQVLADQFAAMILCGLQCREERQEPVPPTGS